MSDILNEILNEIREQLEAILLAVQKAPKARAPKIKPPPKTAYGWFRRNWADAEFRAMLLDHIPSVDDALEDPAGAYRGLDKDESLLVRSLFEAQRDEVADA